MNTEPQKLQVTWNQTQQHFEETKTARLNALSTVIDSLVEALKGPLPQQADYSGELPQQKIFKQLMQFTEDYRALSAQSFVPFENQNPVSPFPAPKTNWHNTITSDAKPDFANDSEKSDFTFSNEFSLESDGWCQLFPFGDFPGKAVIANSNGTVTSFDAIQRLDRPAAEQMVSNFYSVGNRIKRFIKGCSIFNGHPDMPDAGNKYPDKEEKGLVVELQIRDNGLYCKPAFNNAGEQLLKQPKKLFFSGRWLSDELAEEDGKRVFRPDSLKSVGITPRPNLPVQQLNEKPPIPTMKKIIARLLALGITVANDATEDQVDAAVGQLADKLTTAASEKATLANDKTSLTGTITARDNTITSLTSERDTARTNFANERQARIKMMLDGKVTGGFITEAERADWQRRLSNEAEFSNESAALDKLAKKVKTESQTLDMGGRKVEIANAADRRDALNSFIAEEMGRNGNDRDKAFATAQKKFPQLFDAMAQPKLQTPKL